MSRTAVVLSVDAGFVSVLPVIKLECASCSASCGSKQESVPVSNPKGLPLKAGDIVFIETNGKRQTLEALFSLLFPFISAIAGYFAAGPVASRFAGMSADGIRAVFVLLFLFLASGLVLVVTRLFPHAGRIDIVGKGEAAR